MASPNSMESTSQFAEEEVKAGICQSVFKDQNQIAELQCCICKLVLRNPRMCQGGHQFCMNCICQWIKIRKACPQCRAVIRDVNSLTVPLSVRNLIDNADAMCRNGEKSPSGSMCNWVGPYGSMAAHDWGCDYKMIHCEHCSDVMQRKDLEEHIKTSCPKVPEQCRTCGRSMERGEVPMHKKFLCGSTRVQCPLKCGKIVLRQYVVQHVLTCPNYVRTCPLPGCMEMVSDLASHKEEKGTQHTHLLMKVMMEPNKTMQVYGAAHGFTWTVTDATVTSKSDPLHTPHHQWSLLILPTDRKNRRNLGLYAEMIRGEPTIVAIRIKLTYRNITKNLTGNMFMEKGEIKGWENALMDEEMDQEDQASSLTVNMVIQLL
ncbi:TNF receptor-associated factor 5-like [Branchiostoma floridae]|uniref:TNF receptor-associated factor 5-like n=1 Tax=Branchiostoma floridae TaxID=7739 RepID=A0A9J7KLN4_BRAFL|nr:TNF receptor-associated factor 5-like [Branchiostoma floridae]